MKKIFLLALALVFIATPVLAQTKKPAVVAKTPTINISCVKKAVLLREQKLIMVHQEHSSMFNKALIDRQTALSSAWDLTDVKARKAAVKKAWDKFSIAKKDSSNKLKKLVQIIWTSYKSDAKKCKLNTADYENKANEAADSILQ